jgi:hypothetical protein
MSLFVVYTTILILYFSRSSFLITDHYIRDTFLYVLFTPNIYDIRCYNADVRTLPVMTFNNTGHSSTCALHSGKRRCGSGSGLVTCGARDVDILLIRSVT